MVWSPWVLKARAITSNRKCLRGKVLIWTCCCHECFLCSSKKIGPSHFLLLSQCSCSSAPPVPWGSSSMRLDISWTLHPLLAGHLQGSREHCSKSSWWSQREMGASNGLQSRVSALAWKAVLQLSPKAHRVGLTEPCNVHAKCTLTPARLACARWGPPPAPLICIPFSISPTGSMTCLISVFRHCTVAGASFLSIPYFRCLTCMCSCRNLIFGSGLTAC